MSPSPRSALLPLLPPSFPCSFALVASLPPCSFRPSSSPLPRYPHSRATLHRVPARHLPCETRLSNRRSIFSVGPCEIAALATTDRKSTRLNSSHPSISYAVFCLKKKKNKNNLIN